MHIAFLCKSIEEHSGWARYTQQLATALENRGHTITIWSMDSTHIHSPLRYLSRPWNAYGLARHIKRLEKEVCPDVIHITVEPYALATVFLPRKLRQKIILTIHGSYGVRPLQSRRTRWLTWQYYRYIPRFVMISCYTKNRVLSQLRSLGKHSIASHVDQAGTVLPNSIPIPPSFPQKKGGDQHTILCVGGVKPIKGILESIEACTAYKHTYKKPFRFFVVGMCKEDDDYVRHVRQKIHQCGLEENVFLTGSVSEEQLAEYYAQADLFLMPAKTTATAFEGFGLVFLEANAHGIPCIGPDNGGGAEAIDEGKSGYHIDPNDPAEIAERMHRILDVKTIKSEDCFTWAKQHSMEKYVRDIEIIYSSLG